LLRMNSGSISAKQNKPDNIRQPIARIISAFYGWLRSSTLAVLTTIILAMFYFVFARPFIYYHFNHASLIEWLIVCIAAGGILEMVREKLKTNQTGPLLESDWYRHVQQVNEIDDEDFDKIVIYQADFVANGTRRDFLLFARQLLLRNGTTENEVGKILRRVIEYKDYRIPWYYLGLWRRRAQEQNLENRREAMIETIHEMGKITH
jgi:hypothetical protein